MPTITAPHVQSKSGQTGLTTVLPVNGRRSGIANEFVCDRMVMLLRAVLMSTIEKGRRKRDKGQERDGRRKVEVERERERRREKAKVKGREREKEGTRSRLS